MTLRRKCNGAKHDTEASDRSRIGGRGAFPSGRSRVVRLGGRMGSDYADMSNDKTGKKPVRRKPEVSWVKVIFPGLVGP